MAVIVPQVELEIRRAVKSTGLTMRQFAEAAHISVHTLRGMAYNGKLTSIETLYDMTSVSRELYVRGPKGVAVMRFEDDLTPPPASPGAARAVPRKDVA